MVKIIVPSVWTPDGRTEFEGTEGTLRDVIKRFAAVNPSFGRRVLGPDSELLTYVNFCVDDEMIPRSERVTTVVHDGSTVTVVAPMAGG
jgi:sulfur-carrier protein